MNTLKYASARDLSCAMMACEQMPGLSVLEHGRSVNSYFHDLRNHFLNGTSLKFNWRLPDWALNPILWSNQLPLDTINTYQIFHDCGKPACLSIDKEGKKHFPNHAEISAEVWASFGSKAEVDLIRQDMDIHLLKADDLTEFAGRYTAATLLVTGLCEVHSNAVMFGGIDSKSFKIKWKHLNRRGKAITNIFLNNNYIGD